jgi:hypothetical protein
MPPRKAAARFLRHALKHPLCAGRVSARVLRPEIKRRAPPLRISDAPATFLSFPFFFLILTTPRPPYAFRHEVRQHAPPPRAARVRGSRTVTQLCHALPTADPPCDAPQRHRRDGRAAPHEACSTYQWPAHGARPLSTPSAYVRAPHPSDQAAAEPGHARFVFSLPSIAALILISCSCACGPLFYTCCGPDCGTRPVGRLRRLPRPAVQPVGRERPHD